MIRKDKEPVTEKCCYNKFLIDFFWGDEKTKTRKDKKMVKLYFLFFLKIASFGHILKKPTHSCFDCMVIPLSPTFGLHLVRAQRLCKLIFLKNLAHESWTIKSDHGKEGHLPWSDYMVHGENRPLALGWGESTIYLKILKLTNESTY